MYPPPGEYLVSAYRPIAAAVTAFDAGTPDAAGDSRARVHPDAADAAPNLAAACYLPSRRHEGWTAPRQREFLEGVALGHSVEAAARSVGLSPQSAYAFRASARGAVFALGWRAALLLARDRLADTLLARAMEGQTVTITRADGSQVERHFHDTRLALATLTRLDRLADGDAGAASDAGRGGAACGHAARLVAQDWESWLDLVEAERGPARAALFLAHRTGGGSEDALALEPVAALARADLVLRTGAGTVAEVAIDDLDPARRAGWTAEQWARAEAAGLLQLAPPPQPPLPPPAGNPQPSQHSQRQATAADDGFDACTVWWDDRDRAWRTDFPPKPDFFGLEEGEFGDEAYARALDDDEQGVLEAQEAFVHADRLAQGMAERDAWLAAAHAELAACVAERTAAAALAEEPGDLPAVAGGSITP